MVSKTYRISTGFSERSVEVHREPPGNDRSCRGTFRGDSDYSGLRATQEELSGSTIEVTSLRAYFGDALLIRSGNSMEPTPRALKLIETGRTLLGWVHKEIEAAPTFDPATSTQPVSLALSDVGEVGFLPGILTELRRQAPHAMVRSVSLPPGGVGDVLEDGTIDLAIG